MRGAFIFYIMLCSVFIEGLQAQDLNRLVTQLNTAKSNPEKIALLKELGGYYQKQLAYGKATDYFQQALVLEQQQAVAEKNIIITRNSLAYCLSQQKKYDQAISQLNLISDYYKRAGETENRLHTLQHLAYMHKKKEDYPKAIEVAQEELALQQQKGDSPAVSNTYNNLGYLYYATGDHKQSLAHYQKAVDLNLKGADNAQKLPQKALFLTNLGVSYAHLQDFRQAQQAFTDAFDIYQKLGDTPNQAHIQNYLAANYYVSGKTDMAITSASQAIEVAKPINEEKALLESYQIMSEAHQQNEEFPEAQKYAKMFQELKEKMQKQERSAQEQILNEQLAIEKKENEVKQLVAEQEKQKLALKQSELEREKQEQDIKLKEKELKIKEGELLILKRSQELQMASLRQQQLEKEQIEQLLEITKQKAIADKERLMGENQKAETARQKLLAEKERIEKEKEQKAREASEVIQKSQKKEIESERSMRQYFYAIIALIALITILVIIGLLNARRTSRKLRFKNAEIQQQKEEILSQNEELSQSQEEILAQRDFIDEKNKELSKNQVEILANRDAIEQKNKTLEDYNRQVRSSINAAMTIQRAILPYDEKIRSILPNYSLIFLPKDVVSGDFFWLDTVGEKKVLVIADCTGHGVPGAFMTLIGNTILDKIIHEWDILDPAVILAKLHGEIKQILRQDATQNNSGMDLNILCWRDLNDKEVEITWAGAKQDMLYLPSGTKEMQRLKAVRRSIGGEQNEKIAFQNTVMVLPKKTLMFSGSDGLADQNNLNRKRFGDEKIIQVLEQYADSSLEKQKEQLLQALEAHMEDTPQRDDILWLGIEL